MPSQNLFEILVMVASVHFVCVVSPGPDFALVVRNSLTRSRLAGIWTAAGIATSNCVHILAAFLGVGALLASFPQAPKVIQTLGAIYLLWIGFKGLTAKKEKLNSAETQLPHLKKNLSMYRQGFLTSFFNAKAILFFIGFISSLSAWGHQMHFVALSTIIMTSITLIWFCMVSFVFSTKKLQLKLFGVKHWIERITGCVLILFGLTLLFIS
ncbi:MAG: LysE family translocator [Deltaproteobacteria bacterium]|nr:LysE family translocator [Deltaproteobacteria bacterium]